MGYEHIRQPLRRKSRKKLIIPAKKRVESLLASGYDLQEIADATIQATRVKQERVDSAVDYVGGGPRMMIDFLTGAFEETTGSALKAMDVLGIGVGAVIGVGVDVTDQTSKFVKKGSRVIFDGVTTAVGTIVKQQHQKLQQASLSLSYHDKQEIDRSSTLSL